jgi:hypothetical protein
MKARLLQRRSLRRPFEMEALVTRFQAQARRGAFLLLSALWFPDQSTPKAIRKGEGRKVNGLGDPADLDSVNARAGCGHGGARS